MVQLTRLNNDSSWLLSDESLVLALDPWIDGPQIDGAAWFSKQHLTEPGYWPTQPVNGLIISHPFTDHWHKASMQHIKSVDWIVAPTSTCSFLKSKFPRTTLHSLHHGIETEEIVVKHWKSGLLKPVHCAISMYFKKSNLLVVYAPHGFTGSFQHIKNQHPATAQIRYMSTTTRYALPFWLGGPVNLGLPALNLAFQELQPHSFTPTHDAQKQANGLVAKLAKVQYAQPENIQALCDAHHVQFNPISYTLNI